VCKFGRDRVICLEEEETFVPAQNCPYHVTFDLDLDLEHTLDAGLPDDHRVQVWWLLGHLPGRRSDFRASTKVPVSRDL